MKRIAAALVVAAIGLTPELTSVDHVRPGAPAPSGQAANHRFTLGEVDFLLDGAPFQIIGCEMHPARIPAEYLGASHQDGEGDGLQHHRRLPVLELPRDRRGRLRLHDRQPRRRAVRAARAAGGPVGVAPPRPLCVRRVGLRGHPGLSAALSGSQGPLHEPAVHAGGGALHPAPGGGGEAADGRERGADHHGPDRKRVRQLRQRPRVHGAAQERVGRRRDRRPVLYGRRPDALHARGGPSPGRRGRPRLRFGGAPLGTGARPRARRPRLLVRNVSGLAHALGRGLGAAEARRTAEGSHVPARQQEVVQLLRRARRHQLRLHCRRELRRQGLRARPDQLRLRRPHRRTGPGDGEVPRPAEAHRLLPSRRPGAPAGPRPGPLDDRPRIRHAPSRVALEQPAGPGGIGPAEALRVVRPESGPGALPDEARGPQIGPPRHHRPARLRQRVRGRQARRDARPEARREDHRPAADRQPDAGAGHPRRGHGPHQLRAGDDRPQGDHRSGDAAGHDAHELGGVPAAARRRVGVCPAGRRTRPASRHVLPRIVHARPARRHLHRHDRLPEGRRLGERAQSRPLLGDRPAETPLLPRILAEGGRERRRRVRPAPDGGGPPARRAGA